MVKILLLLVLALTVFARESRLSSMFAKMVEEIEVAQTNNLPTHEIEITKVKCIKACLAGQEDFFEGYLQEKTIERLCSVQKYTLQRQQCVAHMFRNYCKNIICRLVYVGDDNLPDWVPKIGKNENQDQ